MSDAEITNENSEAVHAWLLPELVSERLIKNESANAQRSGFHRNAADLSAESKARRPVVDRRAMTEAGLQALTEETKQQAFTEGRAEGYNAGYSEGEKRAKDVAKTILEQQQSVLHQLIQSISQPIDHQRAELQHALTLLIADIAQQLCLRELKSDNSTIRQVVEEAIAALPIGEKHVQVFLHPDDLAVLQSIPDFIKSHWQLQADAKLQLGDCRVESEHSLVDFRRSQRMQSILEAGFDMPAAQSEEKTDGTQIENAPESVQDDSPAPDAQGGDPDTPPDGSAV